MNILVIFPNRLGDTILCIPFLNSINENFKNCKLHCLVSPGLEEFIQLVPVVDKVYTKSKDSKLRIINTLSIAQHIKNVGNIDLCFCLSDSFTAALISFFSRIPIRVGHKTDGRSFLLTHSYKYGNPKIHLTNKSSHLLGSYLKTKITAQPYVLELSKKNTLGLKTKKKLIFNVNSLARSKIIPLHKAVSIINCIQENYEFDILLIGSGSEKDFVDAIIKDLAKTENVFNYAGKTSLVELAHLLLESDLMISTDTGTAHMANAVGLPLIVFFGSGDVRKSKPFNANKLMVINQKLLCSPCLDAVCKFGDPKCLVEIDNQKIMSAVDKLLEN